MKFGILFFEAAVFLGAFAELRKETYLRHVFLHMEHLGFHCTDFHEIWCLGFRKSVEKIQASLKYDKNDE